MKKQDLESKFYDYITALNLTNGLPGGHKDVQAIPGTVFLQKADPRCGSLYAISKNGERGTVSTIYGYCDIKQLYGYMCGIIEARSKNTDFSTATNLLKWAECLQADIAAGAIEYEDGTTYDRDIIERLNNDIKAAKEAL